MSETEFFGGARLGQREMKLNHRTHFCDSKDGTDSIRIPHSHHYLLCAEGICYFLLALMEFLAHTIPVIYQDLSAFRLFDIILGI